MKLRTLLIRVISPALVLIALIISLTLPETTARHAQTLSYPPLVCPGALGGSTEKISLPAKDLAVRSVNVNSTALHTQKSWLLSGVSSPLYVSGNSGSEVAFETISGSSTADTVCELGGADQWFIGGSGGVTSQSEVEFVNSGLSPATVQIFPFNSKVGLAPITVNIKANSDYRARVSTIVPGDELIALHIVTDSGRVTSFLLDHRKSGLSDLGASFVTPVDQPQLQSFMAGLYAGGKTTTTKIRFLVPGNIDANVHLSIYTSDGGIFTPIGFDALQVTKQKVVELPLPKVALSGTFGLGISSDQPVLASAITQTQLGGADFSWASQLKPLARFRVNLNGNRANFFFIGKTIAVNAAWNDASGKPQSILISGQSSALWSPIGPVGLVTFTPLIKSDIYGGATVLAAARGSGSTGGLNYLPLLANQKVAGATEAQADIQALTNN